jgi:hypothetical protein
VVKLEDGFFPCTSSPARNAHTPSHSNMCKGPSALAPFGAAALLQTAATFLEEKQTAVRTLVKESGDAITTPTIKGKAKAVSKLVAKNAPSTMLGGLVRSPTRTARSPPVVFPPRTSCRGPGTREDASAPTLALLHMAV